MNAVNHWWSKYMILRALKKEYEIKRKKVKHPANLIDLDGIYIGKFLEAIK